jgi:hypothetical protein
MKTPQRLLLSAVVVAIVVVVFWGLAYVGTRTEGPLARALGLAGTAVSEAEDRVTRLFQGRGRESQLEWFKPYRADISKLQRPDDFLLGAYDNGLPESMEGIIKLEETLQTTLPLVQVYTAWGDRPDQQFPRRIVQAIWNLGSVPAITWEPWLVDFENAKHPHLPLRQDRDRGGMASVAGGLYDFYIDQWAADAAAFGKPIFLRFAHEMNDPYRYPWGPQNNSNAEFLDAWKHVVDRFRSAGATNVLWVWSPHLAYEYYPYYPGDNYVDWVATLALNYGTVANWSRWWTFEEIFGQKYEHLAVLKKPIMISEFGSLVVGGDRAEWIRDALERLPERFPMLKALLFFHNSSDATVTYQQLDWSFAGDSTVVQVVRSAIHGWKEKWARSRGLD